MAFVKTIIYFGLVSENNYSYQVKLVRAECVRCPWLLAQTKVATIFGIFSTVVVVVTLLPFTPEGIVVGF